MLKGFILLILVGAAVFFVGRWWSGHGEKWSRVGDLPEEFRVESVAVSDDGVGVIGGYIETLPKEATLEKRMWQRTAIVWRLEEKRLEKVYEEIGWINSIHCSGSDWFAVLATLKATLEWDQITDLLDRLTELRPGKKSEKFQLAVSLRSCLQTLRWSMFLERIG